MNLLGRTINGTRTRFERFNIVIAILLAGWVPSILMLWVAYTILTRTLETKILRDRQTLVQLIAHLVGDDLTGKTTIIEYYQTLSTVANNLTDPNPRDVCQQLDRSDLFLASAHRRHVHYRHGRPSYRFGASGS